MRSLLRSLMAPTLLVCVVASCVQTSATMLTRKTFPALTPEEVTIYLDETDIPGDYEKIAILNAKVSSDITMEDQIYKALKKRAAGIGANGILYGQISGIGTERRAEVLAIFVSQ